MSPLLEAGSRTAELFRHLYRHLLRESTYLPDEPTREHFRKAITRRFRDYCPRQDQPPKAASDPVRQASLYRNGRAQLRTLAHANHGDSRALEQVLKRAYGRIGRRRWELLAPLREPEVPVDHEAVGHLDASPFDPTTFRLQLPPALEAVLKAQQRSKLAQERTGLKKLNLDIPDTNTWGRRMPACRVRNMKRERYGDLMQKVLPPLPAGDYERVRRLAAGREPVTVPQRRGTLLKEYMGMELPWSTLSPKKVSRVFQKILLLSNTTEREPQSGKWKVIWESENRDDSQAFKARQEDLFLFQ